MNVDVSVVVPAAGCGQRFGCSTPKQYHRILGKPLLQYAVESFEKMAIVKRVIVVVDDIERAKAVLTLEGCNGESKVTLVKGEATRHRSIRAGVRYLESSDPDVKIVLVHDGVRPVVPNWLVIKLVESAVIHGAAGTTRPLTSTVIRPSTAGSLESCLDRNAYLASETPQAFQFHLLSSAYRKCSSEELDNGTECLRLVLDHCVGVQPLLIPGPETLFKVTLKRDLCAAASDILRESGSGESDVCIISTEEAGSIEQSEGAKMMEESLLWRPGVRKVVRREKSERADPDTGQKYNTVILFHSGEISQEEELAQLAHLLDVERTGLIVHVIENARVEGMQSMSVYGLQRNGRQMAHRYGKLKKGVVLLHCLNPTTSRQLVELVATLVAHPDPTVFSGQTFFL